MRPAAAEPYRERLGPLESANRQPCRAFPFAERRQLAGPLTRAVRSRRVASVPLRARLRRTSGAIRKLCLEFDVALAAPTRGTTFASCSFARCPGNLAARSDVGRIRAKASTIAVRSLTRSSSGSHCRRPPRYWWRSRIPRRDRREHSLRRPRAFACDSACMRTIGPGRAARRRAASATASPSPSTSAARKPGAASGSSKLATRCASFGRQALQRRRGKRSGRGGVVAGRENRGDLQAEACQRSRRSAAIRPRRRSA